MLELIVAGMFTAGAIAQVEPAAPEDARKSARKICEVYQETGSRLGKKRICLAPEQWRERRRADRGELERAQQNVGQATAQ